ncbi:MAG TPA: hypothetical protein DCP31_01680 [Cyanobacteria bacterium UBA8543]|nr:hypothetical protein [Cyanobacteria bacterium UBA8543]
MIERYNQTVTPKDTEKRRFKLDEIDIKVKKTRDVGGGKEDYLAWKQLFMESDLVFYLVRADKLLKRDLKTEQRVEADLNHIRGWIQQSKSAQQVFIIGTHCDLDPEFRNIKPNNVGDYVDRFRQLPSVTKMTVLASNVRPVNVVIGSLENEQSANQLVSQIFQQVLK